MLRKTKIRIAIVLAIIVLVWYYFALPGRLFNDPYSTVLEDYQGKLLSASIADDGQWRFPKNDSVPERFIQALLAFEDKRFYSHWGIDVRAMGRALRQNIGQGRVVSGGSTVTMQVIRLSRKGRPRNVFQKLIELVLASRLELRYNKAQILSLYASHAPFGGNVVGLEAACWRYFGRDSEELSWGEAALLAVLPNSPSLMHLNKNREKLKAKRNWLLDKLRDSGKIDDVTCSLAKDEPIPEAPLPLPRYASHLLTRSIGEGHKQERIASTIQLPLQIRIERIVDEHHQYLKGNQIFNAAVIVLDVNSGNVLAYVGNTQAKKNYHSNDVDIITAPRSTGSILKPFLYAAMLDQGKILPQTLLPDVPTLISGFAPKNFTREYDGAVPADKALIRSLNVPAVHMLRQYRYEKFHSLLGQIGITTLTNPPDHYGLSMILGGAEGTLWDISSVYASMARTLNRYFEHPGKNKYNRKDFHSAIFRQSDSLTYTQTPDLESNSFLSASSIYQTFDALKEVYRPGEETGWQYFNSSKKIAWKTGTSFGLRDGWAVGVTPEYVVGVWVGNADGEGRPGLTGTEVAAPLMFDVFSQLPGQQWFQRPKQEMERIKVCAKSGQRNTDLCVDTDSVWVSRAGLESQACQYHKKIHLSPDRRYRVNGNCESVDRMIGANWFVLPPIQEFYYRLKNVSYKPLPLFRKDCQATSALLAMELIYPKPGSRIFLPRELDGKRNTVVFELAHRNPGASVFWHMDGNFVGMTQKSHHLAFQPSKGRHILTVVDESGESLEREFEVISDM
jgi:penicillin-binding protein 1C